MDNLEAIGWLVLWAIEISEFDIRYCPRTAIKAQALVDFIAEFMAGKNWQLGGNPLEGSNERVVQQMC